MAIKREEVERKAGSPSHQLLNSLIPERSYIADTLSRREKRYTDIKNQLRLVRQHVIETEALKDTARDAEAQQALTKEIHTLTIKKNTLKEKKAQLKSNIQDLKLTAVSINFYQILSTLGVYLTLPAKLSMRLVNRKSRDFIAEMTILPYSTRTDMILANPNFFKKSHSVKPEWEMYEHVILSGHQAQASSAMLYKLRHYKQITQQKLYEHFVASEDIVKSGRIYSPSFQTHTWQKNLIWMAANIHIGRNFILFSTLNADTITTKKNRDIFSAYAREIGVISKVGYKFTNIIFLDGHCSIILSPTKPDIYLARIAALDPSGADIDAAIAEINKNYLAIILSDPDFKDESGNSPAHIAANKNDLDLLEALIANRFSLWDANACNETACSLALKHEHLEFVIRIIQADGEGSLNPTHSNDQHFWQLAHQHGKDISLICMLHQREINLSFLPDSIMIYCLAKMLHENWNPKIDYMHEAKSILLAHPALRGQVFRAMDIEHMPIINLATLVHTFKGLLDLTTLDRITHSIMLSPNIHRASIAIKILKLVEIEKQTIESIMPPRSSV